jgi:TonB family protein
MALRRTSDDEVEELRQFVEHMKRGTTPATGDSLLETLRQIHDKREAPAPSQEHRQMLLERLRIEMAARSGSPVAGAPVVLLAPRPKPRPALRWALAASLVVHAAAGVVVLTTLRFDRSVIAHVLGAEPPGVTRITSPKIAWIPAPPDARRAPRTPADANTGPNEAAGSGVAGDPRENGPAVPARRINSDPQAAIVRPVRLVAPPSGPPLGGVAPIVDPFGAVSEQFAENLSDRPPVQEVHLPPAPDHTEPVRPWSEVLSSYDSAGPDVVPHRIIYSPRPVYTDDGIEDRVQGVVKISAVLGADGAVRDVRVLRGLGHGLDEAAIRAVRSTRFQPATRAGKAVSVTVTFNVRFTLR